MDALFALVAVLFGLKILANVAVWPELAFHRGPGGVSMVPPVEVILLPAAIALAATLHRRWPWTPGGVALFATAILVASYFPLVVVLVVTLVRRVRRRLSS